MSSQAEISDNERPTTGSAVSLYGSNEDAMEEFPVLKAFQQYIDAEQAKSRKRMVVLCVVFGLLMVGMISVFVALLMIVSSRNQALSDRLVDYAMKKLEQPPAAATITPTVVQAPADDSAIRALTDKISEMQKNISADRERSEKAIAVAVASAKKAVAAATEAAKPKESPEQEAEIKRLKDQLAAEKAEKEKLAAERERQRHLEDYRRKHYPELYEKKTSDKAPSQNVQNQQNAPKQVESRQPETSEHEALLKEVDQILKEDEAISYFEYEDESDKTKTTTPSKTPAPEPEPKPTPSPAAPQKEYSIPVDVKGSSSSWLIPTDD